MKTKVFLMFMLFAMFFGVSLAAGQTVVEVRPQPDFCHNTCIVVVHDDVMGPAQDVINAGKNAGVNNIHAYQFTKIRDWNNNHYMKPGFSIKSGSVGFLTQQDLATPPDIAAVDKFFAAEREAKKVLAKTPAIKAGIGQAAFPTPPQQPTNIKADIQPKADSNCKPYAYNDIYIFKNTHWLIILFCVAIFVSLASGISLFSILGTLLIFKINMMPRRV